MTGRPWSGHRRANERPPEDTTERPAAPAAGRLLAPPVDRLSAADQMALLLEGRTTPMVGAMLVLGGNAIPDPAQVMALLGERLRAVPRLRQRVTAVPFGCGRPIWVDDPAFEITDHVSVVPCPAPGGQNEALTVAARLLATRLPRDRPLWMAAIVTGMQGGQAAVIIALHHALADGMGAVAVLSALVDGEAKTADAEFPRPAPTRTQLRADAARQLLRDVSALPGALAGGVQALIEFAPVLGTRLAPSSLNRPTGPLRRFLTASCSLAGLHDAAHAQGATINDAVVCAVTGALARLLAERGETLDTVTVSVPVSLRRSASVERLGNQAGVMLLRLPTAGDPLQRLRAAARSRAARRFVPAATNALYYGAFGLLAQLGLYGRFIGNQRVNHTFATDLRGPETRLSLGGAPVVDIIALSVHSGNVTISFAVLSYAGRLTVTLIADPVTCPDQDRLQALLVTELAHLTGKPELNLDPP